MKAINPSKEVLNIIIIETIEAISKTKIAPNIDRREDKTSETVLPTTPDESSEIKALKLINETSKAAEPAAELEDTNGKEKLSSRRPDKRNTTGRRTLPQPKK